MPRRNPPDVDLKRTAMTIRANVRQGDSSNSVDWCDDPPQEISALPQDVLCNAQVADVLRGNLVASFLKSCTHPFAELTLFPKFVFEDFPTT